VGCITAIVDIVLLIVSTILFQHFDILKLICLIAIIGTASILIYLLDKVVKNEVNCTFYMGIFSSFFSICAALVPYAISNYENGMDNSFIFVIIMSICLIRAIVVLIMHKKRLVKDHYKKVEKIYLRQDFLSYMDMR